MHLYHSESWLEWGGALGLTLSLAILLVATLASAYLWQRTLAGVPPIRRHVLSGLRVATMALLVFLILQPVLVRPANVKSEQVVAILHDDSRSMQVMDGAGESRAARLEAALKASADVFDQALRERFHVLEYGFGERLRTIQSRKDLSYASPETRITDSVRQTVNELKSLALTAVVVLSDGGQQAAVDDATHAALEAMGVPVFTVGTGESEWHDLALGEVALSRAFFDDAPARITAQFTATGMPGSKVVAEVVQKGVVQSSVERTIEGENVDQQVQLDVTPRNREWLDYTVRIRVKNFLEAAAPREFVSENNEASVLLDNREKSYRILYFSGRPNWQYKFVRHALAQDPELHLSSLIRVSGAEKTFVFQGRDSNLGNPLFEGFEEKDNLPRYDEAVFLRMGLDEGELADGYPTTPEALYPFHLIIWADIEADFFAPTQFRLTQDAVAERGASFFMLGGPHTLGGGGYKGSLIESMLPALPGTTGTGAPGQIASTPEGFLTGIWALHAERGSNNTAWAALPPLPGVDALSSVRIGASVFAEADSEGKTEPAPFLVQQRYGRGKSVVIATGETWPWHLQTESDNQDHERLWRQLVRALVSSVPEPVTLVTDAGGRVAGSETTLRWVVNDPVFRPVEGASLTTRVNSPSGEITVPLSERLDAPGTYEGTFTPAEPGKYGVVLEGTTGSGVSQPPVDSAFLVSADTRESTNARFDPSLLQKLAQWTGGQYFRLSDLKDVAPAIAAADREHIRVERVALWHHPFFYGILVTFLCVEWTLRRRWGNA